MDIVNATEDIETVEIQDSDPTDYNLPQVVDKDCYTLNSDYIEVIDIDKDSDDIEIIENNEPAIVIDDDIECMEVSTAEVQARSVKEKLTTLLEEVCTENHLLGQIIEECINLDSSGSMHRIINKTLIPLYLNCNVIYKNSYEFQNNLRRTINLLETSPRLKFSHLKSLCELLKYDHVRKRLPRLSQTAAHKLVEKRKRITPRRLPKRRKSTIVDLSEERTVENEDDDVIVINDNVDSDTQHIVTKDKSTEENIYNETATNYIEFPTQNKENIINNTQTNSQKGLTNSKHMDRYLDIDNQELLEPSKALKPAELANDKSKSTENEIDLPSQELLRPTHVVIVPIPPAELANAEVKRLENEIKELKQQLAVLEEMEVTEDDYSSPYIRCEEIKEKIVHKYKKICKIMGMEPTKRHEVKLQVAAGHPEGPSKCLEEYLNDNIDEYGNPPFPDIFDVVDCVDKANKIYNLNWTRKKIVREAENLLKIYGKALQKRRKKREWRDMVSLCKEKMVDPADFDPMLEDRLLKNRRIGIKNEEEVLNRYVQLDRNTSKSGFSVTVENDDETDSEYEMDPGPSLSNNIVNNTSVEIINNIYLDIINDTGVDVVNNTRRKTVNSNNVTVNHCNDFVNNTSPEIGNNTNVSIVNNVGASMDNNADLDIVNSNNVTINNCNDFVNNTSPEIGNNTSVSIVNNVGASMDNNADLDIVNSNNVTINNCNDFVNNTSPEIGNNTSVSIVNNVGAIMDNNADLDIVNSNNVTVNHCNDFVNNASPEIGNNTNVSIVNNASSSMDNNADLDIVNSNNVAINNTINNHDNIVNNTSVNIDNSPSVDIVNNTSQNIVDNTVSSTTNISNENITENSELLKTPFSSINDLLNTDSNEEPITTYHTAESPNNVEENVKTTDKTKIDNVEYSRTILLESELSDSEPPEDFKERYVKTELDIKVKKEREDVMKLLQELGTNVTATVFDIEDPFLVIEISDSSDSEDESVVENL